MQPPLGQASSVGEPAFEYTGLVLKIFDPSDWHSSDAWRKTHVEPAGEDQRATAFAVINFASSAKAVSTFSPVLAGVDRNGASWAPAAFARSGSWTPCSSFRSALFARNSTGTFPVTLTTAATHSSRSSRVSRRVTSQTARTPRVEM